MICTAASLTAGTWSSILIGLPCASRGAPLTRALTSMLGWCTLTNAKVTFSLARSCAIVKLARSLLHWRNQSARAKMLVGGVLTGYRVVKIPIIIVFILLTRLAASSSLSSRVMMVLAITSDDQKESATAFANSESFYSWAATRLDSPSISTTATECKHKR